MIERDAHHTLFERRSWSYRPEALALRENPSMIARGLARSAHTLLHQQNASVVIPTYHTLVRVYRDLPKDLDVFDGIDEFCSLVEESNKPPPIKPIEIKINDLCIEGMRDQIPHLLDGLPSRKTVIL